MSQVVVIRIELRSSFCDIAAAKTTYITRSFIISVDRGGSDVAFLFLLCLNIFFALISETLELLVHLQSGHPPFYHIGSNDNEFKVVLPH